MSVLVDTSIWVEYFRTGKNSEKLDFLIDENLIVTNDLILAELVPALRVRRHQKLVKLLQNINKLELSIAWDQIIEFQFKWTEPPDITVTDVTSSKTVAGQGYSVNFTVTVENHGDSAETFNVTTCADLNTAFLGDEINIGTQMVTLSSGDYTTLTFTWNTAGVAKGSYTISAKAIVLPGETYTVGNTQIDGTVTVTFPGDVNGDYKVRVDDILAIALAFGSDYPGVSYKANLDINGDGKIRIDDVLTAAVNFGTG